MVRFLDRQDAGLALAEILKCYSHQKNCVAIGLARGGIILARAIAKKLDIPFDFMCPKKISHPHFEEYGVGAVTEDGDLSLDRLAARQIGLSQDLVNQIVEEKKSAAIQRVNLYRQYHPKVRLENQIVILVDDGLATGHTLLACIESARRQQAKKVIAAIPVSSLDAYKKVEKKLDGIFVISQEPQFQAVGEFYQNFDEVTDQQIINYLKQDT